MRRGAITVVVLLVRAAAAADDGQGSLTASSGGAPAGWFDHAGPHASESDVGNDATTGVGGGTFSLNALLGADRYYAAGITGQNTVSFNLEAGHFWNGHETLQHVATNSTNFVNAASTFGGGGIAPLYDRHATWAAMLIGGRQSQASPQLRQQGIAPGTDLRSAAIATGWSGAAYALGFDISPSTYQAAFGGAFGAGQVINSSYGYADPAGTSLYTRYSDARAFANPGVLHVVSAGNAGSATNSVNAPGSGYNTLTVAALGNANTFNSVASFSSRGPQDYGYVGSGGGTTSGVRAAVDLAAPGTSITSAFYGGQTGGNNQTLSNSTDQGSDPAAYSSFIDGTSFAAPLVAGGAALVSSAARTLAPLAGNSAASSSMVVKSLLLTGADKTAGWNNGQAAVTVGDTSFIRTTQSLDWAVGAGRMNLDRTFEVQTTGQTDVAGTATGLLGDVEPLGWDFGNAQVTVNNDYILPVLADGSPFTATLSWMRNRSGTTVVSAADRAQANLDLSLWQLDEGSAFSTLIARSASLYNTVEHLHVELPGEGRYGLRVEYPDNSFDLTSGSNWGNAANRQAYGLAWTGFPVSEPATWALALAGLGAVAARRRRAIHATVPAMIVTREGSGTATAAVMPPPEAGIAASPGATVVPGPKMIEPSTVPLPPIVWPAGTRYPPERPATSSTASAPTAIRLTAATASAAESRRLPPVIASGPAMAFSRSSTSDPLPDFVSDDHSGPIQPRPASAWVCMPPGTSTTRSRGARSVAIGSNQTASAESVPATPPSVTLAAWPGANE